MGIGNVVHPGNLFSSTKYGEIIRLLAISPSHPLAAMFRKTRIEA
jgi:hypothetical protein